MSSLKEVPGEDSEEDSLLCRLGCCSHYQTLLALCVCQLLPAAQLASDYLGHLGGLPQCGHLDVILLD